MIFVSVDTLRADHLGLYGYSRDTSPNLDRISREAVTFDRAQAPRGLTWPSLVSMLTSLYPKSSNVRRNGDLLSEEVRTLADILKGRGYTTAAFLGNACGVIMRNLDTDFCGSDEEAHRNAIRWLEERDDSPFFFWVHYNAPHEEYSPPPAHDVFTRPDYRGKATGERTYLDGVTLSGKRPEQKDLDRVVALYDGEVRYADSMLGEVWETLSREGLLESSIVVFTSDHGEELLQHNNYFYHSCSIYESVLHIPLVIRFPDQSLSGVRISQLVENIDITPTLLELLGVDLPNSFEGQTLLPLLNREPGAKERFTRSLAEYHRPGTGWIGSIRTDRWHYTYNPEKITTACRPEGDYFQVAEEELYDHSKDAMEVHNVATLHADVMAELKREILEAFDGQREWGPPRRANPEVIERLKAMGYLAE
jgi:arylsulfatase A-like enzyme